MMILLCRMMTFLLCHNNVISANDEYKMAYNLNNDSVQLQEVKGQSLLVTRGDSLVLLGKDDSLKTMYTRGDPLLGQSETIESDSIVDKCVDDDDDPWLVASHLLLSHELVINVTESVNNAIDLLGSLRDLVYTSNACRLKLLTPFTNDSSVIRVSESGTNSTCYDEDDSLVALLLKRNSTLDLMEYLNASGLELKVYRSCGPRRLLFLRSQILEVVVGVSVSLVLLGMSVYTCAHLRSRSTLMKGGLKVMSPGSKAQVYVLRPRTATFLPNENVLTTELSFIKTS